MKRRLIAYSIAALAISATAVALPTGVASAAPCSDVDVSFARGTGNFPASASRVLLCEHRQIATRIARSARTP